MTKDEALKLALEAMTYADACLKKQLTTKGKHQYAQALLLEAGTAIKEALAQPEPKYIAFMDAPQRTWIGLTDAEANELWESTDSDWELMKRTEAKLKAKNGFHSTEKNT